MVDDRPYVYAVSMQLSPEDRKRVLAQLQRSGSVIRSLEQMFGPYPFTEIGGVLPSIDCSSVVWRPKPALCTTLRRC